MVSSTQQIFVAYELDNAESLEELSIVKHSIESLLLSIQDFSHSDKISIVTLSPEGLNAGIAEIIEEAKLTFPSIGFRSIVTAAESYFGAKNSIASLAGEQDIIVFCDSDCVYEKTYVSKIVSAVIENDADIAYGKTYANLEGKSRFSRIAALCWQFPPIEIGYNGVWGKSRWANNFAVRGRTLLNNPFPEINLSKPNAPQIKIEGVLWQNEANKQGMRVIDTDASCSHHIFESFGEFASRQYIHGVADAGFSKLQVRFSIIALIPALIFLKNRSGDLTKLFKQKQISKSEYGFSLSLLMVATPIRFWGLIRNLSLKMEMPDPNQGKTVKTESL